MEDERVTYLVRYQDEMRARGGLASSPIPTLGAPTTALDQYRTVAVHENNLDVLNTAVTDIYSAAAIAKVAEGEISHYREIEAAEVALQALLLHERVRVLTYGPKIEQENGIVTYLRFDNNARTQLAYELFNLTEARDWLIAPEYVRVRDGRIYESTLGDSPLLDARIEQLYSAAHSPNYWSNQIGDALSAALQDHNIPLYLSDPRLTHDVPGHDFARQFYERMRARWDHAVEDIPPIVCPFNTPPLLAIVLDRLNHREKLLDVVAELREELAEARRELHEFNYLAWTARSQAELERKAAHIQQSFDAIIPESRLSDAQRIGRSINVVHRLTRPLLRFMVAYQVAGGVPYESLLQGDANTQHLLIHTGALTSRTVTASTFSQLVKVQPLPQLIATHFSQAEVAAIQQSLREKS